MVSCRLAPTLIMIACVQIFGRAAWHSVLPDPTQLVRFRGFLRWNTSIFITFMIGSYILILIGNVVVVNTAPDAVIKTGRHEITLRAAYAIVETGLIIQSLFLLAFMVLVFRWRYVTQHLGSRGGSSTQEKLDLEGPSNERSRQLYPSSGNRPQYNNHQYHANNSTSQDKYTS